MVVQNSSESIKSIKIDAVGSVLKGPEFPACLLKFHMSDGINSPKDGLSIRTHHGVRGGVGGRNVKNGFK